MALLRRFAQVLRSATEEDLRAWLAGGPMPGGVDTRAPAAYGAPAMPDLTPLKDRYQAVDDPRVMAFFARHPDAVAVLVEAHPHIVEVFDARVTVHLEPSYFDDDDQLFAKVRGHGMDAVEALERFEELFSPWWHTLPAEKTLTLNVTAATE